MKKGPALYWYGAPEWLIRPCVLAYSVYCQRLKLHVLAINWPTISNLH